MVVGPENLATQVIEKVATLQCVHDRAFHLAEAQCNVVLFQACIDFLQRLQSAKFNRVHS